MRVFPDGFIWGAATASYQVEGGSKEGGRGQSIWDTFAATPGKVVSGDTGEEACDHYHRYGSDVALMRDLGLRAYRFSVAWPRIQADGRGPANPAGLAFYDRLVDELLEAGITPYSTLYHWDLPQALEDEGGWTNRDTAYRFAEYAALVHQRLGDRVEHWTTLNEPWVSAFLGYGSGVHAPGRRDGDAALLAAHHLMLGHGLATKALRTAGAKQIMLVLNTAPVMTPAQVNDPGAPVSAADAAAIDRVDIMVTRRFLDPVLLGSYPTDEGHPDGDLEIINQPIDMLGVNYYNPIVVEAAPGEPADPAYPGSHDIAFRRADAPVTAMDWPIVPSAFSRHLVRLARDYPTVPFMITENGAAFDDAVENGRVHDLDRQDYLSGQPHAVHDAP